MGLRNRLDLPCRAPKFLRLRRGRSGRGGHGHEGLRRHAPYPSWALALAAGPRVRDRDLTVKGSRHLTFHITVKLTIKEEMLNLTCRQTFSFVATHLQGAHALELEEAAHPPPTRHGPAAAPRSSALRSTDYTLYHASAAQDMHSRACGVCMPEAVGVRSLRAARERLPSARELVRSSPREL